MEQIERKSGYMTTLSKECDFPTQRTVTSDILEKYLEGSTISTPFILMKSSQSRLSAADSSAYFRYLHHGESSHQIDGPQIPPGLIQATQKRVTGLARPQELHIKTVVDDKYEKKGRKFVLLKSEVFNSKGEKIGTSWLTPIWSK
jgi:hypothetical protein